MTLEELHDALLEYGFDCEERMDLIEFLKNKFDLKY